MADDPKERATSSWMRPLNDGRVEIMCRAPGYRIRLSAPEEQAWQAIELFEGWTGLTVRSERRPPRKVPEIVGQMCLMSELPVATEYETGNA